eukprot:scaffold119468_cov45-Phaeocystis_antarctica.AAC.2
MRRATRGRREHTPWRRRPSPRLLGASPPQRCACSCSARAARASAWPRTCLCGKGWRELAASKRLASG